MSAPRQPLRRDTANDGDFFACLNAVRLIVVSFIGLGYASTMAIGPHAREWLNLFGYDPSLFGLQVLFFLSGWLAWRSLSQGRHLWAFILSRATRTLPWLALYTFIVVAILYPLLHDPAAPTGKTGAQLALYFIENVTLINPGDPMPGALDNAHYAGLLQGSIWSLQWGAIAFAGLLGAYWVGLRHQLIYVGLFAAAVCAHVSVNAWSDSTGSDLLSSLIPGLRLAFPFLLGIVAYGWRDRLPRRSAGWLLIALITLGAASLHYYGLRWSYAIEITAMTGWCAHAMAALHSRGRWLKHWPNLVLPFFLGVWPTAQTVYALAPTVSVPALVAISLGIALSLAASFYALARIVRRPVHRRVQPA
jgi:peptidoglycan/LPS O-acetylase OafA/YrhL